MKVRADKETPIKPSPFNPDATWLAPQWKGDALMSVEVEVADLIYSFLRAVKPRRVLETGTWKGFSTVAIASALKRNGFGRVTTVDKLDQKYIPSVLAHDKVHEHQDKSSTYEKVIADVLDFLPERVGKIKYDVIFCDDLHSDEHVKKELEYFDKLISKPGYIMFHDTYFVKQGDIGKVVKDWAKEKGYDHLPFYTSRGFDIVHVK